MFTIHLVCLRAFEIPVLIGCVWISFIRKESKNAYREIQIGYILIEKDLFVQVARNPRTQQFPDISMSTPDNSCQYLATS